MLFLLSVQASARGFALSLFDYLPQASQLFMDSLASSSWVRRRSEGARGELRVLFEGAIEPDCKLPCNLQGGKRLGMRAALVVSRTIACDAELMKEVSGFTGKDRLSFSRLRRSAWGSSGEARRPAFAAVVCASNSLNCRSLMRQVLGSS